MSISRRASTTARILGVSAGALTIAAFGAAQTAGACDLRHSDQPHQDGQDHNYSSCTFSTDGGRTFVDASKLPAFSTPGNTVTILVQGDADHGCDVSLAAYKANGPTWETSGKQTLVSWDSTVQEKADSDHIYSLKVTIPADVCFAQVDLYKGHEKYDGHDAQHLAPEGPDHPVIGTRLLKAWNGATGNCDTQGGGAPSSSASPSASASESASASPSTSASESASASASASTSAPASASGSGSPAPSAAGSTTSAASASASVEASGSASGGVATTPSSTSGSGGLASTGSDGTGTIAALGATLVTLGAGAVYLVRRKRAPRH